MNYRLIDIKILEVFQQCNIKSFPIDIDCIYEFYNLVRYPYTCRDEMFSDFCLKMSDDAFYWEGLILFNDEINPKRQLFSFSHELGHHILEHSLNRTDSEESEANYFASHILAPRMAIHYAKCKNLNDVSKIFGMTHEAADYAFQDYRRWHRYVTYHKMSEFDKEMYQHFYDERYKGFVYNTKECTLCGRKLINFNEESCFSHTNIYKFQHYEIDPLEKSLIRAEKDWLYGGL